MLASNVIQNIILHFSNLDTSRARKMFKVLQKTNCLDEISSMYSVIGKVDICVTERVGKT